ncbi:MAG: PIN domain-containing protein [Caldimonas sp.]
MKKNYVLVDFENVRPESVAELDKEVFRLMVFIGAHQNKVKYELVAAVQRMGERAEYVKIAGEGKNNLDFHIACYAGRQVNLSSSKCPRRPTRRCRRYCSRSSPAR